MNCIVGLGNIGNAYAYTKHNIGFMILDEMAKRRNLVFKPGKGHFFFVKTEMMTI